VKSLKVSTFLSSFTEVRAQLIFFFILLNTFTLFAQQEVKGLIFDATTKQRVAGVYLYNTASKEGVFNNLKGEFHISAKAGDVVILAREGYFPDTIRIENYNTLMVNLQRSSIWLREVHIMAKKSPQQDFEQKQADYESAYRKGDPGSLLSTGSNGGAGLSIDALFSLISREGKNARYLQEIIERDYREAIIDYRFTAQLVKVLTGLEDEKSEDFMRQYRPSYYFILNSNDYELGIYIKKSFESYKVNPDAKRAQGLFETLEP
jgi:hypothetical protein